ncbi:MAG TPA: glycoside hydrolase family 44 protein [Bryocella sp.]|nr:glycoside hydrolase family 44 protein [Bryocella sp.]
MTVTPNPATAIIGSTLQLTATVNGTGSFSTDVTWSVAAPSGSTLSAGTISSTGLYTTPYPAPPTVTVTATSTQDTTKSGSVTVTLAAPATATGPALTVDGSKQTHAISPLIYGMNAYLLDPTTAANANITVARWGGDDTSRYNYENNVTNSASDYYFENSTGAYGMLPNPSNGTSFTQFISANNTLGITTLGTVPVQGWVSNSTVEACSFTESAFPGQQSYNGSCGNGVYNDGSGGCTNAEGCDIYGNDTIAAITSISEPPPTAPGAGAATISWAEGTWPGGWVNSVVSNYGPGNPSTGTGKGVAIWDLDNEPAWWDAVHRDVHPNPSTYDEVTNGGVGTALAIKTVDPTAQVSGPVIDYWWNYFYSKKDIENGWSSGPCYQPWDNPTDRKAHGGVPMIEYYLQQMAAASSTYGMRLLDYVDIHAYFAATYQGSYVGLTTAGDTGEQEARMNSTRVFWDPTYTDPDFPQPNYITDSNYTSNCSAAESALQAPELIPMLQSWVAKDYPGTKTAIDEYNFGGLESINGAVTQADILGIFGAYGLDLATLWPTEAYTDQIPGNMAFVMYRNYDGNKSTFGDMALASTSADQGQLSVYGATRSSDQAVTVIVINKTYGSLTTTLSLADITATGNAAVYQYSNANLTSIVSLPAQAVTPPASGSMTSTISATFPAQSITLFVIPTT